VVSAQSPVAAREGIELCNRIPAHGKRVLAGEIAGASLQGSGFVSRGAFAHSA